MNNSRIKNQAENFSDWYDSIVEHAQLAQKTNVKGTIFFLPRAWAIWENIQKFINAEFAKLKVQNVAFPTLLTLSDLEKEKNHVEGFAPELFLVSKTNKTSNPTLALRPTSEVFFCNFFSQNLQSYTQLPLLLNQWCNVFRVEKNTKAFLRTSEFFWQELHTVHETVSEKKLVIKQVYEIYQKCLSEFLGIAFLKGEKTVNERFAGADHTYTLEAFMPDGQSLQACTTHDLGQNFSQAFNIKFQNRNNQKEYAHQTSAGISTRIIGAIIMSHGDNKGLVLPFKVAPIQIAVLNLLKKPIETTNDAWKQIFTAIQTYRYEVDASNKAFGFKIQNQELYGTPFIIALGQKELDQNKVLIINRLDGEKVFVAFDQLKNYLDTQIVLYEKRLYEKSWQNLKAAIVKCHTLAEVQLVIEQKKIALVPWFNDADNEVNFKAANFGFSPRCIADAVKPDENLKCFFSKKPANCWVYFARSY